MTFKKGDAKPDKSGRTKGTVNKHTAMVREVLEEAFQELGGVESLVRWVRRSGANRTIFYSQMYMRLLPVQVQGSGKEGEFVINVKKEELAQKLIDQGLPPIVFGVEVPKLEDMRVINGNGNDNGDKDA